MAASGATTTAVVIGISGCTRSGKSWLSGTIAKQRAAAGLDCSAIHQDDFWEREVVVIDAHGKERKSEEEPECTNFAALAATLRAAIVPCGDVSAASPSPESHMIIVEGFNVLHDPAIVALLDVIVVLDLDYDEAKRRRTAPRSGLNPNPLSLEVFDAVVWPQHVRYVAASVDTLGRRAQHYAAPSHETDVNRIAVEVLELASMVTPKHKV